MAAVKAAPKQSGDAAGTPSLPFISDPPTILSSDAPQSVHRAGECVVAGA